MEQFECEFPVAEAIMWPLRKRQNLFQRLQWEARQRLECPLPIRRGSGVGTIACDGHVFRVRLQES